MSERSPREGPREGPREVPSEVAPEVTPRSPTRSPTRSPRKVSLKVEKTSSEERGFRTAAEELAHLTAKYHRRGLNTDWRNMEYRIESGEYPPATGELTSYETESKKKAEAEIARKKKAEAETARKIKADAEKLLLQENKKLQEKYDKMVEKHKRYGALLNELKAYIAEHCPKKKLFKTLGGQRKTKKRKYKRSKHRHTKKPN